MFLNKTLTKKFIKQAIKSNQLSVGRLENGMCVIAGRGWVINIEPYGMTNWFKSALVELIGDIPDGLGELYEYGKDGYCQVGILTASYDLSAYSNTVPYFVTPLTYTENCRIVQNMETSKYDVMREIFFEWINAAEINPDVENFPIGPNVTKDAYSYFIYKNSTMTIAMQAAVQPTETLEDVLYALHDVDFREGAR